MGIGMKGNDNVKSFQIITVQDFFKPVKIQKLKTPSLLKSCD